MSSPYTTALEEIDNRLASEPGLVASLVPELKPRVSARRVRVICPECNHDSAFILPGTRTIHCERGNNCRADVSVLGYLVGIKDSPSGKDFIAAVEKAAAICNVPIAKDNNPFAGAAKPEVRRDDLETVWRLCNEAIQDTGDPLAASPGFVYLQQRGFKSDFINSQFGFMCEPAQLIGGCANYVLVQLGFLDRDGRSVDLWRNRVIIPARDAQGRLVGFIGRSIDPNLSDKDKYRNSRGYSAAKHNGFGIDLARRYERIILVEGQMDVLKARQHGIENILAAGTSSYGSDSLMVLANYGVREIVSALDTDKAGIDGLLSLLKKSDEESNCPEIYVLENLKERCVILGPHGRRPCKDPDEFITEHGAAEFRVLLDAACHGLRWRATAWANQHSFEREGELFKYLDRCAEYAAGFRTKRAELRLQQGFFPVVAELTGLSVDDILEIQHEKARKENNAKQAKKLSEELLSASQLAQAGDLNAAQVAAVDACDRIKTESNGYVSKIPMGSPVIEEIEALLQKRATREFIGLPNRTLPTLDNSILGLRGLILLAGGTNVGKTTLLGQLAMDVVKHNEDACVLFLSIEMSRLDIAMRMWSRLASVAYHQLDDVYRPIPRGFGDAIWAAREELLWYHKMIRIWSPRRDKTPVSEQTIIHEVEDLKAQTGRKRCMVVIDYIDVMPPPPGTERMPRNEIERALCEQLLNVKEQLGEDPLVAVSEIRKATKEFGDWIALDDLMGSARKGYATDTAMLWNKFTDQMLYEHFELVGNELRPLLEPFLLEDPKKDMKKPEVIKTVREMRLIMGRRGIDYGRIDIPKVRDGGTKGTLDITNYYRVNNIVEGLE